MDIVNEPANGHVLSARLPSLGTAPQKEINEVSALIAQAKNPVLLLGLMASQPRNADAVRRLLTRSEIPVTSTYQAAGVIDQNHFSRFAGRGPVQ